MKIISTIEARMTSTRLPGKVLLPALGIPLLQHLIQRLKKVPTIDEVVVATTTNATDDCLAALAEELGVGCFRGSEDDVLSRVLGAAQSAKADVIVEITGDCPIIDPAVVQRILDNYLRGGADYVSNTLVTTYPIGMDTQVFATDVLAEMELVTRDDPAAREHVSLPIYRRPQKYRLRNIEAPPELRWPELAVTLDTPEDYQLIKSIIEDLYPANPDFSLHDVITLLRGRPDLRVLNQSVKRKTVK